LEAAEEAAEVLKEIFKIVWAEQAVEERVA
jgi:hypothetical protein